MTVKAWGVVFTEDAIGEFFGAEEAHEHLPYIDFPLFETKKTAALFRDGIKGTKVVRCTITYQI